MPMHAECDIVLPILSDCSSVCPMPVLCQKEWTYHHTFLT